MVSKKIQKKMHSKTGSGNTVGSLEACVCKAILSFACKLVGSKFVEKLIIQNSIQ